MFIEITEKNTGLKQCLMAGSIARFWPSVSPGCFIGLIDPAETLFVNESYEEVQQLIAEALPKTPDDLHQPVADALSEVVNSLEALREDLKYTKGR